MARPTRWVMGFGSFWVGPWVSISDQWVGSGHNVATQNFPGRAAGQCLRPMTRPKTQNDPKILKLINVTWPGIDDKWVGSGRARDR
ncbi:hypothetical protein PsorP6_006607 [Peronosclerospora sorghi]|uniref:Uncharacterized protein n=1 Tax=Peronosclerospora sorghi TaxID=230839 RepID=A0ACC0W4P7_9STRA|nr:hypothetical protein PsorP6_006607 [Peronosclerospora sorghi]